MSDEDAIILCTLVDRGPASCPATIARCCRCDREVWLSDSSPPATPYCNQCFDAFVGDAAGEVRITKEHRAALRERLGVDDAFIDDILTKANEARKSGVLGKVLDIRQPSKNRHPSQHKHTKEQP